MSTKRESRNIAQNKKARHYYELLDFIEAGIALTGSEMKSIRSGHISFNDAYVIFKKQEAWIQGLHIAPYNNAGYAQHDPDRNRKLLLHKKEISTLATRVEQKGLSIIPVNLHFTNGKVKVELAVGKGKKLYDQRHDLKNAAEQRDIEREMARR